MDKEKNPVLGRDFRGFLSKIKKKVLNREDNTLWL